MTISIRKFLLINLLLAITVTTSLTAIGNYYLDQKDIQRHLDTLMALTNLSYQSLLGKDINKRDLLSLQEDLNHIPRRIKKFYGQDIIDPVLERNIKRINFQVWTDDGRLLLHSKNSPNVKLNQETEGFTDKIIDGQLWRLFSTYDPKKHIRTVVAERYDSRNDLGHRIAIDDLYIMLLTFPLSGLLIWIIIGRGLSSLERVAKEVHDRAPTFLEPVDIKGVPVEIKPVITEINQLFFRLQQAFDREKRFAADAAHELRTPLAALKTQAQVASKTLDNIERKSALDNVIVGVDRSSHIVQQLLTLSRLVPEATHIDESSEVNLSKLAREMVMQIAPQALERNIDLELKTQDSNVVVFGNYTALSILMRNLIDNAIRYTPEHGHVVVNVKLQDSQVLLTVRDNGPGIPSELRSRVFERFFRVLGNKSPGSGLGLAIVQQIAKLHHSTVHLGAPDEGTGLVVTIIFPAPGKFKAEIAQH